MRKLFLVTLAFFYTMNASSQSDYSPQWKQIEEAVNKNQPKTALELLEAINKKALKSKNEEQIIKSQLYMTVLKNRHEEQSELKNIKSIETELSKAGGLQQSLYNYFLARAYQTYYNRNGWEISQRTNTEDLSSDIDDWTADKFDSIISQYYLASLQNAPLLQSAKVTSYPALFSQGTEEGRADFPSVYDVLCQYAFEYFSSHYSRFGSMRNQVSTDDPRVLDRPELFVQHAFDFKEEKTQNCLQVLQEWERYKLRTQNDYGLQEVYGHQLEFGRYLYYPEDENDRVEMQRWEMSKTHNNSAKVAMTLAGKAITSEKFVTYVLTGRADSVTRMQARDFLQTTLDTKQLREIDKIKIENKIKELEVVNLRLQTENVVIPGQPFLQRVEHRNINEYKNLIYRLEPNEIFQRDLNEKTKKLEKVREWEQTLTAPNDLSSYSTEIKIDALDPGNYLLLSQDKNGAIVQSSRIQCSNIALVSYLDNENEIIYQTLDRTTGQKISVEKAELMEVEYETQGNHRLRPLQTLDPSPDGIIKISDNNIANINKTWLKLSMGDDTFYAKIKNHYRRYPHNSTNHMYHIYTDRAIYRPGQTIKAMIMGISHSGDNGFNLLQNKEFELVFRDANYQEITKKKLRTDDYGTGSVVLQIPETGLTGMFSISIDEGFHAISVEEYKRPTFEVSIDTPTQAYKLDDEVTILGTAKSYAGVPMSEAKVVYRVVRSVRYPYPCFYMPMAHAEEEIAHGETVTDEKGVFTIDFVAQSDRKVSHQTYPLFDYRVYADVTEMSGETRSADYSLSLSSVPYFIKEDASEMMDISSDKKIKFECNNAQGKPVKGNMRLKFSNLQAPQKFYQSRLWGAVSYQTLSEADFRESFPYDAYMEEDKKDNWEIEKVVFDQAYSSIENLEFDLSKLAGPGVYRMEVITQFGEDTVVSTKTIELSKGEQLADVPRALMLYTSKSQAAVNDQIKVKLLTYIPDAQVLYYTNRQNDKLQWLNVNKTWKNQLQMTEADRGSSNLQVYSFYRNREYASSKKINIPWTNKELGIKLITYKNKTEPGAKEHWSLKVEGLELHQKDAQVLASMYDQSLDEFVDHRFEIPYVLPDKHIKVNWVSFYTPELVYSSGKSSKVLYTPEIYRHPDFNQQLIDLFGRSGSYRNYTSRMKAKDAPMMADDVALSESLEDSGAANEPAPFPELAPNVSPIAGAPGADKKESTGHLRKNLQETAFFYPQLQTDADGKVQLDFTMPEALTRWRLMILAHSKDLAMGYVEHSLITQKDLMITPQLPRYLRQGDHIDFTARIDNLSEAGTKATAELSILDALSGEDVSSDFGIAHKSLSVSLPAEGQTTATWSLTIPDDWSTPIRYQVMAHTSKHSDGQEGLLPVVTNRILVTESMPLQMMGNGEKTFEFDKKKAHTTSTSTDYRYSIEYSGSPIWYAVQSLPYLLDYPYDCSEQVFNKIYATSIAEYVAKSSPDIVRRIEVWAKDNPEALKSNLSKNQELKSATLQETPWVQEAQTEEENMRNLYRLFDENSLHSGYTHNINILQQRQQADGGFAWFEGGKSSEYITTYIAMGICRLQQLQIPVSQQMQDILDQTKKYIHQKLKERRDRDIRGKRSSVGELAILQLYVLSFSPSETRSVEQREVEDFFIKRLSTMWMSYSINVQAMLAIVLQRNGYSTAAEDIMTSLDQTAIHSEEKGMYWKDFTEHGYYWYQSPIEGMAMMIAAYEELKNDKASADEQRLWLLKNKQVNSWKTTKATADACYALLYGNASLSAQPEVDISLGSQPVKSDINIPGMEYIKASYAPDHMPSGLEQVSVKISKQEPDAISWGAVYWQYFEDMDKVQSDSENILNIEKKVYRKVHTDQGEKLILLQEGDKLHVGDKLTVRLNIRADRDLEYVHIKDARAGCVEPVDVLSHYVYGRGLPHYRSTGDISTNFFADHISLGSYVLEYDAFVSQRGSFSMGMASVQCMYAPEYGAHSQGARVEVE